MGCWGLLGLWGITIWGWVTYTKKPNIKIDQNSRSIDVKNPLKIVSIDIDIIDPEPNLDHSPIPYKKTSKRGTWPSTAVASRNTALFQAPRAARHVPGGLQLAVASPGFTHRESILLYTMLYTYTCWWNICRAAGVGNHWNIHYEPKSWLSSYLSSLVKELARFNRSAGVGNLSLKWTS
jgi:hypothetical protein